LTEGILLPEERPIKNIKTSTLQIFIQSSFANAFCRIVVSLLPGKRPIETSTSKLLIQSISLIYVQINVQWLLHKEQVKTATTLTIKIFGLLNTIDFQRKTSFFTASNVRLNTSAKKMSGTTLIPSTASCFPFERIFWFNVHTIGHSSYKSKFFMKKHSSNTNHTDFRRNKFPAWKKIMCLPKYVTNG